MMPRDQVEPTQVIVADQAPVPQTSRWYWSAREIVAVEPPGFGPATVVENVVPEESLRYAIVSWSALSRTETVPGERLTAGMIPPPFPA